jgi:hypothetical protein
MRLTQLLLLFFCTLSISAQVTNEPVTDTIEMDSVAPRVDSKYREDQFYASVSYNIMQGKPGNYSQYSFSTGLTVGFLRDMPVNKRRTYAIAAGLGYSYNNIKHNLAVLEAAGKNTYQTIETADYDKNKLVLHYLELPIELRWRNSDSLSHKFWRVYLGFKVSYLFYDKAQYQPDGNTTMKVTNDKNMNTFIYGAYLSAGWNTWNLYAYYGITPIYNSPPIEGSTQKLTMNSLNLGLIFYIL